MIADHPRLFLIMHAVVGGALVAAATHLVVWTWSYWRGNTARHKGVRRFAWIVASLFAANLGLGLLLYPAYKTGVRVDYLDNPTAAMDDYPMTVRVARWFDVKEHAAALGLAVAIALLVTVVAWTPKRDGTAVAPVVAGMSLAVAAAAWLAAIVGLVTTSVRSIGT